MTQIRSVLDTPIFYKVYELYKLLHSYHNLIPKSERYTLWQRCEHTTLVLLEAVITAGHQQGYEKQSYLKVISEKLDLLKVLIRLAKEIRAINSAQYLEIQTIIQEIGKMIGGWIKSASHQVKWT